MPQWLWPRTRQTLAMPTKQHGGPPPGNKGGRGGGGRGGNSGGGGGLAIRVEMGSYVGNGVNDTLIPTAFQPTMVMVKCVSATFVTIIRTSDQPANTSKPLTGPNASGTTNIRNFESSGFRVGTGTAVNNSGNTYVYVAVRAVNSNIYAVGTYTGDGNNDRQVTVGFQPDMVMVWQDGATRVHWRTDAYGAGNSQPFTEAANTTGIRAFNSTGFTVGTGTTVNGAATAYFYVAFKNHAGVMKTATWSGSGADPRNITDFGFTPDFVLIKYTNNNTNGVLRHVNGGAGDATQSIDAAFGSTADMIQAFIANGIELGASNNVNGSGFAAYAAWGIKETG